MRKFPRGEWLQKKKIHLVPPIITPLLVIPLPKSSSADLDEPIPFLLVQFHSGLRTGPDPQVWHAPPVTKERKGKLYARKQGWETHTKPLPSLTLIGA